MCLSISKLTSGAGKADDWQLAILLTWDNHWNDKDGLGLAIPQVYDFISADVDGDRNNSYFWLQEMHSIRINHCSRMYTIHMAYFLQ